MQNLLEMIMGQPSAMAPADATQYGMDLPIMEEEETLNIPDTAHSFIDKEIGSMSQMQPQVEGTGLGLLELAGKMISPASVQKLPQMLKDSRGYLKRLQSLKIGTRKKLVDIANNRDYDSMNPEDIKKALDTNKAMMQMAIDREAEMEKTKSLIDFLERYRKLGF
tara:strand:- start:8354 stop:8848 length:495 start_codon:yes stop_codon:yes gene_type:complete